MHLVTSRLASVLCLAVLVGTLAVVVGTTTPWRTPATSPARAAGDAPDLREDFSSAEIARSAAFRRAVRPWLLGGLAVGLGVALGLGLTPLGARLVEAVARPVGGAWWARAVLGGLALSLVATVVRLPFAIRSEQVLRRFGLSTQTWAGWTADAAKGWAVSAVLTGAALLVLYGALRVSPDWWWAWAAAGAAAAVFALSFAFPLVVEPLFNRFTPMPDSPLRDDLVAMAAREGYPVRDVLVADASRRTTSLNAYVSGYGASRRIVVYDTLLRDAPAAEVRSVVAHELGHAVRREVLHGTLLAALGAAAAVCGLAVVGSWPALLRRAGVGELADPRSIALLAAVAALAGFLASPAQALVSRRVEARADAYALERTRDPATFVAMQRRLAVQNVADLKPHPVLYAWFASHPSTTERIAAARAFAAREGLPADTGTGR